MQGYDFNNGQFAADTGHFTQLVWVETTHVGAAKSGDGLFVVANYSPAGDTLARVSSERVWRVREGSAAG